MTRRMRLIYSSVMVAAVLAAFSAGYGMRAQAERSQWTPPGSHAWPIISLVRTAEGVVMSKASSSKSPSYKPNLKPYEVLDEVRHAIKDNFVRTRIDETDLTYGAVRGMLRSLGDRFTRFLSPEEYDEFKVKNDGEFVGIGARIDLKEDYTGSSAAKPYGASRPYIVEPIDGGPADKAGLQRDDVILSINGRSTADLSENSVVLFIRGVRGTPVRLKIERKAKAAPGAGRDAAFKVLDVTLTRDVIEIHPVKLEWLPDRIAWLRLDEFNKKSEAEMTAALRQLQKGENAQGAARGLILDMRDNPGGLLDVAVDIGSRFIGSGPIVYTRERDGSERPLNAEHDRFLNLKIPIVVLINKYSA
ncbi:MAG TPA: S41 family peptidase, partial [Abditibacteriaceae bacterium]|nr:S41 family peptidase [Abditibacteriaceae bacterium]